MKAIVVMFDSLNRCFLPPYGCDGVQAPNFERLAEKAVVFDNCYSGGEDRIDVSLGKQTVSQITCPVLMITADLDKGALYPPQAADELVARLPNARHVNIPGGGHNIRREQPFRPNLSQNRPPRVRLLRLETSRAIPT